jgi:hypothetical protein
MKGEMDWEMVRTFAFFKLMRGVMMNRDRKNIDFAGGLQRAASLAK